MKKIASVISVFIVVCMLLSMNVFASDKVLSDIDSSTLVGKAVDELVSLNIIDGYEDNTFRPDNTVTRAEMAKLIVTFMGLDKIGLNAASSGFADVDSVKHWSMPYVKVAADVGIIVGYEDGTFRPDNTVKYSEAVKMIVCALGYGTAATSRSIQGQPWYFGYISIASEKGILNGAVTNGQENPSPRGTVAVLLYNSLDVPVAETTTNNDGSTTVSVSGSTARDAYQQAEKVSGIVTAVYQTGLKKAETDLGKKYIEVTSGDTTTKYRVSSDIDTFDILGYKINASFDPDSSGDGVLTSISTRDSKNIVKNIKADDIESASKNEISYYESSTSTRPTTIYLDSNVSVIYNGIYLKNYTASDLNIKAGTIKTISNDGDSYADVVFVNSYEIVAIRSISTDSSTDPATRKINAMYNEVDGGFISIPTSCKILKITNASGTVLDDPKKLTASKYDIANVMRSKDGEVFELTITRKKVAGSITSLIDEGDRIAINNTEYGKAYNLKDYKGAEADEPKFLLTANVNAYLDMFGNIAAADVSAVSQNTYVGYLVYAGEDKDKGLNGGAKVSVVGLENVSGYNIYNLAANTKIDGVLYKNNYDGMLSALKASATKANEGKQSKFTLTDYAQLIRYTLKNGQIDYIDTLEENPSDANGNLTREVKYPYGGTNYNGLIYVSGSKFQYPNNGSTVVAINSSTKVLLVPENMTETDNYKIKSTGYFSTSTLKNYCIEAYNVNNVGVAAYVLVYGEKTSTSSTIEDNANIYLTKSISAASGVVDGDNVIQDKFTGWDFKTGNDIENKRTIDENVLFGKVDNGDIFRFSTDSNGLIKETEIIMDVDGNDITLSCPFYPGVNALDPVSNITSAKNYRDFCYDYDKNNQSARRNVSKCRLIYGTVFQVGDDGNSIRVTSVLNGDVCTLKDNAKNTADYYTCTDAKIFTLDMNAYDSSNRVIKEGSLEELVCYDADIDNKAEASQVLMFYQSGSIKTILIVKR